MAHPLPRPLPPPPLTSPHSLDNVWSHSRTVLVQDSSPRQAKFMFSSTWLKCRCLSGRNTMRMTFPRPAVIRGLPPAPKACLARMEASINAALQRQPQSTAPEAVQVPQTTPSKETSVRASWKPRFPSLPLILLPSFSPSVAPPHSSPPPPSPRPPRRDARGDNTARP